MIAARRRRVSGRGGGLGGLLRRWTRWVDRAANRGLERAYPHVLVARRRLGAVWAFGVALLGPRLRWLGTRLGRLAAIARRLSARLLRPLFAWFFRAIALGERAVRAACALAHRGATVASAVLTPRRAAAVAIVGAAACLLVSQFVDYRGVEIGQPGYAGLPDVAAPPTVDVQTPRDAHSFLLVPVALAAALLGLAGIVRERRRLGLAVAALGLLSLAVILLVDLPNGLDVGAESSRFAGASAELQDGFWAELAAAAGLVVCGLLYYARPCLTPISSSGRAASARRRRPRRRASSRGRVARSA